MEVQRGSWYDYVALRHTIRRILPHGLASLVAGMNCDNKCPFPQTSVYTLDMFPLKGPDEYPPRVPKKKKDFWISREMIPYMPDHIFHGSQVPKNKPPTHPWLCVQMNLTTPCHICNEVKKPTLYITDPKDDKGNFIKVGGMYNTTQVACTECLDYMLETVTLKVEENDDYGDSKEVSYVKDGKKVIVSSSDTDLSEGEIEDEDDKAAKLVANLRKKPKREVHHFGWSDDGDDDFVEASRAKLAPAKRQKIGKK